MRRHLRVVVGAILVLSCAGPGHTQPIRVIARKLLIKNVVPDDESKNRLVVVMKDPAILVPVPGGFFDPRCGVYPPGTLTTQVVVTGGVSAIENLPCENWRLTGSEAHPRGYRYTDPELDDGTVQSIAWKTGSIKVKLTGEGPSILSVELTPGVPLSQPVEVTLLGGGTGHCVRCAPFDGKDGSDGKTFRGKNCPAPDFCISSPSGAFL
jgi:hypothetical protein